MSYTIACPICDAAFSGPDRGPRNGWEVAWTRAVAHVVNQHGRTIDQAECLLARAGTVERKNGRAS